MPTEEPSSLTELSELTVDKGVDLENGTSTTGPGSSMTVVHNGHPITSAPITITTNIDVHDLSTVAQELVPTAAGVAHIVQHTGLDVIRITQMRSVDEPTQDAPEVLIRDLRASCSDILHIDVSANDTNLTPETRARYLGIAQQYLYILSRIASISDPVFKSELLDRAARVEHVVAPCWLKDLGRREKFNQTSRAEATIVHEELETLQDLIDESDLTDTMNIEIIIEGFMECEKKFKRLLRNVTDERKEVADSPFVPVEFIKLEEQMALFVPVISGLRFEETRQDYQKLIDKIARYGVRIQQLKEMIKSNTQTPFVGPPSDDQLACVFEWIDLTRAMKSLDKQGDKLILAVHKLKLKEQIPGYNQRAIIKSLDDTVKAMRQDIFPWLTHEHEEKKAKIEDQIQKAQAAIDALISKISDISGSGILYIGEGHKALVADYDDIDGLIKVIEATIAQWKKDAPKGADVTLSTTLTGLRAPLSQKTAAYDSISNWKKRLKRLKILNRFLKSPEPLEGFAMVEAVERYLADEVDADEGGQGIGPDRQRIFISMIGNLMDYMNVPDKPDPSAQKKYTVRERLDMVSFPYLNSNGNVRLKDASDIITSFRDLRRNHREREGNVSSRYRRISGRQRRK